MDSFRGRAFRLFLRGRRLFYASIGRPLPQTTAAEDTDTILPNQGEIDRRISILRSRSLLNRHRLGANRKIFLNCLPELLASRPSTTSTNMTPTPVTNNNFINISNYISTSKYTLWNFIPKNLFEQFRRAANVYFLFLAVLQLIPYFGVNSPFLTLSPITFVLFVTAVKDGVEDYRRHKQDQTMNRSETVTLQGWSNINLSLVATPVEDEKSWKYRLKALFRPLLKKISKRKTIQRQSSDVLLSAQAAVAMTDNLSRPAFLPALWETIHVGDLVLLKNDENIPADLVIISTSEPDGDCFIETKNLDGETNLKARKSLASTNWVKDAESASRLRAWFEVESPSSNLYQLNGSIHVHPMDVNATVAEDSESPPPLRTPATSDYKPSRIDISNTLLRGCVLRNTRWVIGLVVYTGQESKIMLNSGGTPSKQSRIEKDMNRQVMVNFIFLFILCLFCAIGNTYYYATWSTGSGVALFTGATELTSPVEAGFLTFWASLIVFQNIIPISLYISIEVVKTFHAFLISQDVRMYDEESGSSCIPRTWNISDDLGQVEYVFSDKTGTLTRNIMEFRKCTILGHRYGEPLKSEQASVSSSQSQIFLQEMQRVFKPRYATVDAEKLTFSDPQIFKDLQRLPAEGSNPASKEEALSLAIQNFFILLAVCHTVVVENQENDSSDEVLAYKAESPDEKALVGAARDVGYAFLERKRNSLTFDLLGKTITFELLHMLPFDSTRKRMSIVVRRPSPWNDVVIYSKGADNIIFERLAEGQDSLIERTRRHIEEYSNEGLRTLLLAQRVLSESEYDQWAEGYQKASTSIENRDEQMEAAEDYIERGLSLLGATAIEDKLQEDVPDCIASLRAAGIKLWVLTGDKLETAINIGFAASLLTRTMTLWTIRGGFPKDVVGKFLLAAGGILGYELVNGEDLDDTDVVVPPEQESQQTLHALVIDGLALKHILDHPRARRYLLRVSTFCQSVICCRVSPLQKAQVVHFVKRGHRTVCLAIGDGANDVSMIQEADVGVAIAGKEGLQAAMASDYTFSQFKFLKPLLLVHGHWSYVRVAEMILNFFFKNVFYAFIVFFYQIYCGYSANIFYEYSYVQLYNLVFTLFPVVTLGSMDQSVDAEHALRYPGIYSVGIRRERYNFYRFWIYIVEAICAAAICFFMFYGIHQGGVDNNSGYGASQSVLALSCVTTLIIVATLYVGLNSYSWNWIMHVAIWGSVVLAFVYPVGYLFYPMTELYGVAAVMYETASFWFSCILTSLIILLPRFTYIFLQRWLKPSNIDIIREVQILGLKEEDATHHPTLDRKNDESYEMQSISSSTLGAK